MTHLTQTAELSLMPQPAEELEPMNQPSRLLRAGLWMIGILVLAALTWAGYTSAGSPDPTVVGTNSISALFDIAVLVLREGLECVLVLAAITAGMSGAVVTAKKPIAGGVILGLVATVATWFIAVGILEKLTESIPALQIQAATGLLAIVVLLVIMNWFFHKVYWGGWITFHQRRRKSLASEGGKWSAFIGFVALGFTSVYREGVEIVLFLQTYRLQWGDRIVLGGGLVGLVLTAGVGVITFVAQRRLPYRKMLVTTGILLGAVLLVMVGEQAQEMQQAHWISTTTIPWLVTCIPSWAGVWFSLFPTVETLSLQSLATILVVGSFFWARKV